MDKSIRMQMGSVNIKISVCIPCYGMNGKGSFFLRENLTRILSQTYKEYEVVISDHSTDDSILEVCEDFKRMGMDIKYIKNFIDVGSSSSNLNNCIINASGDLIKIIFQDDFLYKKESLEDIAFSFYKNPDIKWLVTSCCHTQDGENFNKFIDPIYTEDILHGNNKISSPSVLTFVNSEDKILFDPDYLWLMDCDYYYRMKQKYGDPFYLLSTNVVNRHWEGQLTNKLSNDRKQREHELILKKYTNGKN